MAHIENSSNSMQVMADKFAGTRRDITFKDLVRTNAAKPQANRFVTTENQQVHLQYLPSIPTSPNEAFVMTPRHTATEPVNNVFVFETGQDEKGNPAITRRIVAVKQNEGPIVAGTHVLDAEESAKLFGVMHDPLTRVDLIEDLIKPTEREQEIIEMEISWEERTT